jgi:hypothetical protein
MSASELTVDEASQLIDALQNEPAKSAVDEPANTAVEQPPLDVELVTAQRAQMILWLAREAAVGDAWMKAKLADLGVPDIPEKITIDVLRQLTRSEAIVLSDALSSEIDARPGDE